jgi:hypothetical protein
MAQYYLAVVGDFGPYHRGDIITDPKAIEKILSTSKCQHVRKVAAPAATAG